MTDVPLATCGVGGLLGWSDLVHGYFELGAASQPRQLRIVPDGGVDLLFSVGECPIARGVGESSAVGLLTRAIEVSFPPGASVFGVTLSPHAARAVLGVPLSHLRDQAVDLTDLCGTEARTLRETLRAAPDRGAREGCIEAFLVRRLAAAQSPDAAVGAAIALIGDHGGQMSMRAVSQRAGISERQLERLFSQHAGISPKHFSRIARLQAALAHLARAKRTPRSWGRVAYDFGFADQSHLIREFRALTGLTPSAYLANGPASGVFNTALGDRAGACRIPSIRGSERALPMGDDGHRAPRSRTD